MDQLLKASKVCHPLTSPVKIWFELLQKVTIGLQTMYVFYASFFSLYCYMRSGPHSVSV